MTNLKLTLISLPFYYPDQDLIFVPTNLGLGYIASYVRKYGGHNVSIIDSLVEGFNRKERLQGTNLNRVGLGASDIADRIDPETDFIGINVPFTFYAGTAREVAGELKSRYPHIPIVIGGVYPSTMKQKALHENFDYIVCGEGEIPLLKLLSNENPEGIKGLIFRNNNNKIIDNGRSESVADLDDVPFPAWDLLPMDTYIKFSPGGESTVTGSQHERYACVMTSRQCPFSCTFCSSHPVFGRGWRGRTAKNILEEIRELHRLYSITHIQFLEDNFSFNRKRLLEILDDLIKFNREIERPVSYNASGATRVDSLDEEIIVKMKEANFISLSLPVEHGDQHMNKIMKKDLDLDRARQVVAIARKNNIETHVNILVGHPDETSGMFYNSLKYFIELKHLGATFFHPYILVPFPETHLFKDCEKRGLLNFDEKDCEGVFFGYTGEKIYIKSPHFSNMTVKYRFNLLNLKLGPNNLFSKIRFIAKLSGLKRFFKFRRLFVWFSKIEGTWSRDIKKGQLT